MKVQDFTNYASGNPGYVLVTPAHNEEQTIDATVKSITEQTLKPTRWIIVSDGSTDRTDEIVRDAAQSFPFIRYVRRERAEIRNFSSKVLAIRTGLQSLTQSVYDFIGFLDADITLDRGFCQTVCERMLANPSQGVGGGAVYEKARGRWQLVRSSYAASVSGMMQMFRRECYQQIGGYLPLPLGGIDMMAEVMARMHGWTVMSFMDVHVHHHQRMGRTHGKWYRALFRRGRMEYANGYHPLFQCGRFLTWAICEQPIVVAAVLRTAGYFWATLRQEPVAVPDPVIAYLRREQMSRVAGSLRWQRLLPALRPSQERRCGPSKPGAGVRRGD